MWPWVAQFDNSNILYLYLYLQQPQYGPHSVISQTLQAEIPELVPGLTYEFKVTNNT